MATLREDIVSIGFEVDNDPIGSLNDGIKEMREQLGTLADTEDGLKSVGQEATTAGKSIDDMANGLRAPPGGLNDTKDGIKGIGEEAEKSKKKSKGLIDGLKGFAKSVSEADSLGGKLKVVGSAAGSAAKSIGKMALKGLASGLKTAGNAAADAAGKLAKFAAASAVKGAKALAVGATAGVIGATTAMAGLGLVSIKTGANFESSMSQVAATMGMTMDEANYSNTTYAKLANTAKEMGATTKFSASESAEALNYMALAGYDADKSCAALPTVLNLAASGGMELAAASDMVTDSMSALGIEATTDNLQTFGDQLAKTAQKSNTSVSQLGEAVLTVGGTAKNLAGGTTELNTLLGIIADNGVKGAEGGTALRNILLSLSSPTDTAAKKMKSLGLNVYDAEGKMRPMQDVLNDLNSSMDGMTDQQKQDAISTIFNKADLKSVNALLANSGDRFNELSGYIENSDGAMKNMADTMNDNLTGRITEMKSAIEGAGIAFYESIGSGNLKDLVKEATGWITELSDATASGGMEGLAGASGGVLAKVVTKATEMAPQLVDTGVMVVESLLDGIDQNSDAISDGAVKIGMSLITGIGKIAPKLLTTGMKVVTNLIRGINSNRSQLGSTGSEAALNLLNGIMTQGAELISAGGELVGNIVTGLINNMPSIAAGAGNMIVSLVNGIASGLPQVLTTGVQLITSFVTGIAAQLPQILTAGLNLVISLAKGIGQSIPTIFQSAGSLIGSLCEGLISNVPNILSAAWQIVVSLVSGFFSTDWIQVGKDILGGIYNGFKSWFGKGEETGAEVSESVASGIDNSQLQNSGLDMSQSLVSGFSSGTDALAQSGTDQVTALQTSMNAGFEDIKSDTTGLSTDIKSTIDSTDLYSSGTNIMTGLNNGMLSMQPQLNATAKSIASGISTTINSSLDIHSPSRVTEKSGEYTGLGLVKGMKGTLRTIGSTALHMGDVAAKNISPMQSRYSPVSGSTIAGSRSTSNTYSPSFKLVLNGASASDSNGRKIKRWVKQVMKESYEGMERSNPDPVEV